MRCLCQKGEIWNWYQDIYRVSQKSSKQYYLYNVPDSHNCWTDQHVSPSGERQEFSEAIVGNRAQVINSIMNFFGGALYILGVRVTYFWPYVYFQCPPQYQVLSLACISFFEISNLFGQNLRCSWSPYWATKRIKHYQHAVRVSTSSTLLEHFSRSAFANHFFFSLGSFVSR